MPLLDFAFDGKNVDAQKMARLNSLRKIKGVSKDTTAALRKIITRSIAEGIPPYDAARLIKPMVGLTAPQQTAVFNFRTNLINSGLAMAAVERKTERYIQKSLRVRAKMIARTEIIGSLSLGQTAAWGQAQKAGLMDQNVKKRWMATGIGACPICSQLNDHPPIPVSDSFASIVGPIGRPPSHPNCRCAIVPVPGAGMPGATETGTGTVEPARKPTRKPRVKRPLTGPEIRKKLEEMNRPRGRASDKASDEFDVAYFKVRKERRKIEKLLKKGSPKSEVDRAIKEYDEAVKISDRLAYQSGDIRKEVHNLLLTDTRSEFKAYNHRGQSVSSKNRHETARDLNKGVRERSLRDRSNVGARDADATEFIRRLLGDDIGDEWKVTLNNTGTNLSNGRPNYNPFTGESMGIKGGRHGTINMSVRGGTWGRKTMVHEFGHWIEKHTGWDRESWKWVLKRSKGEKLQQLKKLYPNRSFEDYEWAFEDKFWDAYIGKKYKDASEVLSMGLEAFYADPVRFAAKDPDFFDFIVRSVNEIRGGYNASTRKLKFGNPIGG